MKEEDQRYDQRLQLIKNFLVDVDHTIYTVHQKELTAVAAFELVHHQVPLDPLNSLPPEFVDTRHKVIHTLRRLALTLWLSHHAGKESLGVIQLAQKIHCEADLRTHLQRDEERFTQLLVQDEILKENQRPKRWWQRWLP